jgi:hypothetical protein
MKHKSKISPGEGKHLHIPPTRLYKNSGTFVDRGAGGKDIIDQKYVFATYCVDPGLEGPFNIFSPGFAAETGLGCGIPYACQRVHPDFMFQFRKEYSCQQERLIKAPLA